MSNVRRTSGPESLGGATIRTPHFQHANRSEDRFGMSAYCAPLGVSIGDDDPDMAGLRLFDGIDAEKQLHRIGSLRLLKHASCMATGDG